MTLFQSQSRRRLLRAAVVVVVSLSVALGIQPGRPASAAGPVGGTPTYPLLNQSAESHWGYLENQANEVLSAHGLRVGATRALVRDYIFLQLIHIIDEANAGKTLSPADQGALSYLEQQVAAERHRADVDAYAKYVEFATNQQGCTAGTGPEYSDGSSGMGGMACVFAQAFGTQPNAEEFNAVGFAEATKAFENPDVAATMFDTTHSLSWWSTLTVAGGESAADAEFQEAAQDVLREKVTEAAREVLSEMGSAIFEVSAGESGAASWAALAGFVAVIVASGVWNSVSNQQTADALESAAASTPIVEAGDLAKLTTAPGVTELLYVVLAQTMPSGASIPSETTSTNAFPCSFDSSLSYTIDNMDYSGCFGYTFAADPDYLSARYGTEGGTPPQHTSTDPEFLLKPQGETTATLSPGMQQPGTTLLPWLASDHCGNAVIYNASSARNVTTDAGLLNCAGQPEQNVSVPAEGLGFSSYIHDNMFVTQFGGDGSADPNTWEYRPGVQYVDWQGNWWSAWYQDGTFLHVKVATPIGPVTPGDGTSDYGLGPCNYDPVEYPDTGASAGLYRFVARGECLFADNASRVNDVNEGDEVLVDGQMRTVAGTSECYYFDQANVTVAFNTATYAHCGNTSVDNGPVTAVSAPSPCPGADLDTGGLNFCQNPAIAANAIDLEPGVSSEWSAWSELLHNLVGLPAESFALGAKDNYAMKLVRVNTCAGRSDCTGSTDMANCSTPLSTGASASMADCFVSPTIEYTTAWGTTKNWSATLVTPPSVNATPISPTEGLPFQGTVATVTIPGQPTATASQFSAQIRWGDGATSTGTITAAAGGGFVVSGSHTYTEESDGYPLQVVVTDNTTQVSGFATENVLVADATVTETSHTVVSTNPVSAVFATIHDENPGATVDDYTSDGGSTVINWGDGTTSAGTVIQIGPGTFSVRASHTYAALGAHDVTVKVTDDGGSTATATSNVMVFAYPTEGSFVIGDQHSTSGEHVMFWGAQWAENNELANGTAPAAFKGFENGARTPDCGTGWTTDPGRSANPPKGPLPAYMGVIASSRITQSGRIISGDTPHIVVVATNRGYAPYPGHGGTGVIVAQAC